MPAPRLVASGLQRFVSAQENSVYQRALEELKAGYKSSHWMWFIFPQVAGLGRSDTAIFYAIADRIEARSYLAHPVLGPRLEEATGAMLWWSGKRSAEDILGAIDAVKFRSSMTLFEAVAGPGALFADALAAFCAGERDHATLARL